MKRVSEKYDWSCAKRGADILTNRKRPFQQLAFFTVKPNDDAVQREYPEQMAVLSTMRFFTYQQTPHTTGQCLHFHDSSGRRIIRSFSCGRQTTFEITRRRQACFPARSIDINHVIPRLVPPLFAR